MKKTYSAYALMGNGDDIFTITIYSGYKSVMEAMEGIKRFCSHYTGGEPKVFKTWIE